MTIVKNENIVVENRLLDNKVKVLFSLAKSVPEDQVIVTVDRGEGASALWLAKGAAAGSGSKVYNIIFRLPTPGVTEVDEENTDDDLLNALKSKGINIILFNSYSGFGDTSRKWKSKIGLLLINGLLEYEDIKQVFHTWERHLSVNARVIICEFNKPGPARIIKEYLGNMGDFTFVKTAGNLKVMKVDKCIHHWVIDTREIGICRYCGRERNFKRIRTETEKVTVQRRRTAKTQNKGK